MHGSREDFIRRMVPVKMAELNVIPEQVVAASSEWGDRAVRSCVAAACSLCTVGFSWFLIHPCCGAYDPALDGVDKDARMRAGRNKLLEGPSSAEALVSGNTHGAHAGIE